MAQAIGGPVSGPSKTYIADTVTTIGCGAIAGSVSANAAQATVAGQRCIGIWETAVAVGQPGRVCRHGDCFAVAGAAASHGQYGKVNAAGQIVPSTDAAGSGVEIVGRFESDALAAGDIVTFFVSPFIL